MKRCLVSILVLVGTGLLSTAFKAPSDTFIQLIMSQLTRFYASTYPEKSYLQFDKSATLYWNPTVRTDAAGQATLSFYSSEEAGPFRLTLEGISFAGAPGHGTGGFQVRK